MENAADLSWEMLTLNLRNPFRLSYGTSETRTAFWLRLEGDAGWGEGTIPPYYGISHESMIEFWRAVGDERRNLPDDPAEIRDWVGSAGPAPARAALDLALHDWFGRLRGQPLYALLGLPRPAVMNTSFTIAIDTPEEMARMAREVPQLPVIKMKLGSDADDVARVAAVRAARPDARLRVDANAGWGRDEAIQNIRRLAEYDLELVEQPLAKDDIEGLGIVQRECPLPIVADESVQKPEDVERLAAAGVRGINLKLMKVGGLSVGLPMLRRSRELGLQVMLGCMIETSIGATAMAHLAGLADWLDLDSPLLISNDPFEGVIFDEHAGLHLPDRPGIGAHFRAASNE